MPIFMDRHDLEHTTAADIAVAHQKDLEIQERYGVKFLTYWFDQQRGTVFCLMDAPDKATAHCVHQEAHGFVASEIVEVALSAVEAFLGRIQDPEPPAGRAVPDMDSGRRVVMFTDIVDSIVMTARLGDRLATELVRAHDAVVRRCLSRSGGREVKHLGDGIMASFRSTAQAIDCAAAIQADFDRYNRGNSEPIHVRIGMDSGEPVEDSDDLFGSTVQLAARLCAAGTAGQILVSDNICREHDDQSLFINRKLVQLKGFAGPVPALECDWSSVQMTV
jgi:class 3 adenylate cyclase